MPNPSTPNCGEVFVKNVQKDFAEAKGVGKAFYNNSRQALGDFGAVPGIFAAAGGYTFTLLGGFIGSMGNGVANFFPGNPSCSAQGKQLDQQDFDTRVAEAQAKWQRDAVDIPGTPAAPSGLSIE